MPSDGVFLQSRTARNSDTASSLHFVNNFFSLHSILRLTIQLCVCGEDVTCWKDHFFAKLANSADANCGPLSDTSTSGIPCLAKRDDNTRVTLRDVTDVRLSISM